MTQRRIFMALLLVVMILLVFDDALKHGVQQVERPTAVHLATYTPTATRTPGWWAEVATWTPTPTGAATASPSVTPVASGTPTPFLPTRAVPTPRPTWTEGVR